MCDALGRNWGSGTRGTFNITDRSPFGSAPPGAGSHTCYGFIPYRTAVRIDFTGACTALGKGIRIWHYE